MADLFETINSRSSIRRYKDIPVEADKVQLIAEAGLKAPTAVNRQELHITVVKTPNPVLTAIQNEMNPNAEGNFYYNAPILYIISGSDEYDSSNIDAGIAVENMHLAAQGLGLGSVIIGCIGDVMKGANKLTYNAGLQMPEGYTYQIALAVGYPDTEKAPHDINVDKDINYVC